ncbi:MAG: hypothetical protein VXA18_05360, partial [Gammaproteobacteria bacterium]
MASHLYLTRDYKALFSITLESINSKRGCDFTLPFIEKAIRASYELKDAHLTEFLYWSATVCEINYPVQETFVKFLIEQKRFDEAEVVKNSIENKSYYFRVLEERLFKDSKKFRYDHNYSLSFLQNSNVNNGFSADTISIYGIPFEVSEDSVPKKEFGVKYLYKGQAYKYLDDFSQFRLNAYLAYEDYSGIQSDRLTPFISSELVYKKNNLFALGLGLTSYSDRTAYETQTLSYFRKLNRFAPIDTFKFSVGKVRSPVNQINNSIYKNIGIQKVLNKFYINAGHTLNKTDFGFSSYKEYDFGVTRIFSINKITFKTFYQYKTRSYDSVWMAYGKRRAFDQDYFGIEFLQRDGLGLLISKTNNRSN